MIKHFLTILVSICLVLIFIYYFIISPQRDTFKIKSFSLSLNIEDNTIQGKSSLLIREISLFSSDKIPFYKVSFINETDFFINFPNIPEEGWVGYIYIKVISFNSNIIKKIFISLQNNNNLNFFIKSFSPTYSKKNGNPNLEIQVKESGNLQGFSLQVESPSSYRKKYIFPNLKLNKNEIWKIIFAHTKEEQEEKNLIINKKEKEIKIPFKISDTVGAFSFINEKKEEIEDFLIYSNKKEDSSVIDIIKSIKINLLTVQNKKGFPFKEILSYNILRTYKSKIGANKKIIRKDSTKSFNQNNSYIDFR